MIPWVILRCLLDEMSITSNLREWETTVETSNTCSACAAREMAAKATSPKAMKLAFLARRLVRQLIEASLISALLDFTESRMTSCISARVRAQALHVCTRIS